MRIGSHSRVGRRLRWIAVSFVVAAVAALTCVVATAAALAGPATAATGQVTRASLSETTALAEWASGPATSPTATTALATKSTQRSSLLVDQYTQNFDARSARLAPFVRMSARTEFGLSRAPAGLRAAVRRTLGARAASGGWSLKAELTATNTVDFGVSVAISGSTAVVGDYGDNSFTGAAYVFVRSGNTWSQQAKLTASDGAAGELFGGSVAIYGSTVVVGADNHNSGTGAAYVFTRSGTTWSQRAELTASDGAAGDFLGFSVAISGSTVVVGALGNNSSTGAAYVFARSGNSWSQRAELTASDGAAGDAFGGSVAISGSTVVVGAVGHNSDAGATYVFARSGNSWSQRAELTASDAAPGDAFGYSVAISGSTVVVGAVGNDSFAGAAYVFARSGNAWSQRAELTASDAAAFDQFGESVAISGSAVVVGAPFHNYPVGAAYVFARSGNAWRQQAELTTSFGFGAPVAISGSTLLSSAAGPSGTGEVAVFVR